LKYTTPTYTSAQEGAQSPLHKRKAQSLALSKEEIKLSDPMITNSVLVISKDHKQIFSQKQDPIDKYRIDSSSVRKQSVLKK